MRGDTDKPRLERFMQAVGSGVRESTRIYLTGGSTAVLFGWRESTVDIDMCFEPERDELFRLIDRLKIELDINLEIASPPDFIPAVAGWEDRSLFIDRYGKVDFYHFDPYSQVLSKIERGHDQDLRDAAHMVEHGLVDPSKLESLFVSIESQLYRYPAIRGDRFRMALEEFLAKQKRAE